MSKLIIEESPLQILPSLACRIGLNEALFAQQLKYLQNISKNVRDGEVWVYQTIKEWREIFPFWSERTIRRTINSLEEAGFLIATNTYNRSPIDKTKWYRLDEAAIDAAVSPNDRTGPSEKENHQENQYRKDETKRRNGRSNEPDVLSVEKNTDCKQRHGKASSGQNVRSSGQNGRTKGQNDRSSGQNVQSTGQNGHTYNHKTTTQKTTAHKTTPLHSSARARAESGAPALPDSLPFFSEPPATGKPPKRTRYSPGFERFWHAYTHPPSGCTARTGGKSKAHAYWKRDRLEAITDELVAKAEAFWARDHSWRSGYQPFAQKWLNEKRYDDEPQPEIVHPTVAEAERRRKIRDIADWAKSDAPMSMEPFGGIFGDDRVIEGECHEKN